MSNIPHHIALIPDGNRRWARKHGLSTFEGHKKGFERMGEIIKKAREIGINTMTIWGLSTQNLEKRSKQELTYLMGLFEAMIGKYLKDALKNKVRIHHLGRKDRLPQSLIRKIEQAEAETKGFSTYNLAVGLDYGGQDEIVRAVNSWQKQAGSQDELTVQELEKYLDTKYLPYPDVDLLIRTAGTQRLSGYLPWQSTYAELIFVEEKMPDFTPELFEDCVKDYMTRVRTFGK